MRVSKKLCEDGTWHIYMDGVLMGYAYINRRANYYYEIRFIPLAGNHLNRNGQYFYLSLRLTSSIVDIDYHIKAKVELLRRRVRSFYTDIYYRLWIKVCDLEIQRKTKHACF